MEFRNVQEKRLYDRSINDLAHLTDAVAPRVKHPFLRNTSLDSSCFDRPSLDYLRSAYGLNASARADREAVLWALQHDQVFSVSLEDGLARVTLNEKYWVNPLTGRSDA